MSNISEKLSMLIELKQKLKQQENALIEKRKHEIGTLVEKYNLLALSDDIWLGLFLELNDALKTNSLRVEELKNLGARFQRSRKRNSKAIKQDHYSSLSPSSEVQTHENT